MQNHAKAASNPQGAEPTNDNAHVGIRSVKIVKRKLPAEQDEDLISPEWKPVRVDPRHFPDQPSGGGAPPTTIANVRHLLADRIAGLDEALLPWTEIVVVQPGDAEPDLIAALGYSPLVDPIDGHRWPDPRFEPGWDLIAAHPAAWQLNFSFGSTFGQIVLVERRKGVWHELFAMCAIYDDKVWNHTVR